MDLFEITTAKLAFVALIGFGAILIGYVMPRLFGRALAPVAPTHDGADARPNRTRKSTEKPTGKSPENALETSHWGPIRSVYGDLLFQDSTDQGNLGEFVTSILISSDGYRQVEAKLPGNRGIDGLFIREQITGQVSDILVTETKTNISPYKAAQMEDNKLIKTLSDLWILTSEHDRRRDIYRVAARALVDNHIPVQKQLWRHWLESGTTEISQLDATGETEDRPTRVDNRAFFYSLLLSYSELRAHIGRPIT